MSKSTRTSCSSIVILVVVQWRSANGKHSIIGIKSCSYCSTLLTFCYIGSSSGGFCELVGQQKNRCGCQCAPNDPSDHHWSLTFVPGDVSCTRTQRQRLGWSRARTSNPEDNPLHHLSSLSQTQMTLFTCDKYKRQTMRSNKQRDKTHF